MTILVLSTHNVKCKKQGAHLLIEQTIYEQGKQVKTRRTPVAITNLNGVIIEGYVYVSPSALMLLLQQAIPIIWMRGHELVGVSHSFAGTGTVLTRRAQFMAFESEKGAILAKQFVISGLLNKANLLLSYAKNRDNELGENLKKGAQSIRAVGQKVRVMEVTGHIDYYRQALMALEAEGARTYYRCLTQLVPDEYQFEKRTRRPPKDPINAALSYGYAILHARCLLAVIGSGLDPYGGFLHVDRSGRTSLAIDLAEEFRQAIVDRVIVTMAIRQALDKEKDFEYEAGSCMLNTTGRNKVVSAIEERLDVSAGEKENGIKLRGMFLRQARRIIRFLLDKEDSYRPFVSTW